MRAGSTRRLGLESWEHHLRNTEAEKEGLCSSEAPAFSDLLLLALSELSFFKTGWSQLGFGEEEVSET